MKKILSLLVLLSAFTAAAQTTTTSSRPERPRMDESPMTEGTRRFQVVENIGGPGFFWLDTRRGDLWRMDPDTKEWNYLGVPARANTGPNGFYQLLSDRQGGVYILNTEYGDGWWTDGTTWKTAGEVVRRFNKAE
jgi:hypothetical protein